ncbi:hypothetical protein LAZ67_11002999 [Cordylochernes scorpioides]|uniref:Mos1 transposase HTH domain-containing protein n=1 Tax=Cordylochernes scorpioides TaxID=51811 RepID=A0ABY6L036_9ARAC|nr:hypothetical protein LAZ67_11002999 [Cordylochernes scorpioides]
MATIYDSGFELLPHAPYSPDLAPFDFHLFPHLKKSLSGIHFRSDEEVIDAVNSFFESLKNRSFWRDALEAGDLSKSLYSYAQVRSASVSMELPLVNVSTCQLRSVIRFFTAKNETAVNIHRNLVSVYGEGCMSIQMVRRWRSWFLEGRQNVHDDERSGSPVTATDNAAVAAVRNVVEANRRVTIDEIMIRLPPGIEIGCS